MSDAEKPSKLTSFQKTMKRISGQLSKSEGPPTVRGADKSHAEIDGLQAQVKGLEEELYQARRRLEQVPERISTAYPHHAVRREGLPGRKTGDPVFS